MSKMLLFLKLKMIFVDFVNINKMEKVKYTVDEFFNPFNGNNSEEVWAKIKANKKPVERAKVLEEVKRQYLERNLVSKKIIKA